MRILVTGGTSFIGAPLVISLLEAGHQVRALVREESRLDRLRDTNCRLTVGDIRDAHAVSRAAFGCDSVIHLAYAPVSAEPREIMDTAVIGMSNVLRACELHGVRDLMLASSPRAGNGTYYGHGKQTMELMAAAYLRAGVFDRVRTARIFNAYGPDMGTDHVIPQFILKILALRPAEERLPVLGSGRDRRSFVWIGDCTAQLVKIYESGGSASYDVGAPQSETAIGDLAELIGEGLEHPIRVVPDSPCTSATVQVPSLRKMIDQIPPQVDLPEGLIRTIAWYKQQQEETADAT